MHERSLRIPLFTLVYYEDIDEFEGLNEQQKEHFQKTYDDDILSKMIEALRWASESPDYNFQSIIPDQDPIPTNRQLHRFLSHYYKSIKQCRSAIRLD